MSEKQQPKTIQLPAWLSLGNIISVCTALGAAAGVYAGNIATQATQAERIAFIQSEQVKAAADRQQMRREFLDEMREMRRSVDSIRDNLLPRGNH